MNFRYHPGKANVVVDVLSSRPYLTHNSLLALLGSCAKNLETGDQCGDDGDQTYALYYEGATYPH